MPTATKKRAAKVSCKGCNSFQAAVTQVRDPGEKGSQGERHAE